MPTALKSAASMGRNEFEIVVTMSMALKACAPCVETSAPRSTEKIPLLRCTALYLAHQKGLPLL
jgi:hypothetical protein